MSHLRCCRILLVGVALSIGASFGESGKPATNQNLLDSAVPKKRSSIRKETRLKTTGVLLSINEADSTFAIKTDTNEMVFDFSTSTHCTKGKTNISIVDVPIDTRITVYYNIEKERLLAVDVMQ